MSAKEQMLEYARQHNDSKVYTDEEFCGKMSMGGVVINRTLTSHTVATAKRDGMEIVITETTTTMGNVIENGHLIEKKEIDSVEVARIHL